MKLLDITTKIPPAKPVNPLPLVFFNTSQYKPIKHHGDFDSDPEVMILNNQISRVLKMPFSKKTSEEEKKLSDRQLLVILIQHESQIKSKTKQADSMVANALKKLICKSDKQKNSSENMTQLRKSSISKNCEYTVNCKYVKVNDIMKDVIGCKLQVL